ncbi:MAG: nuclear transport factor 2 family protein [Deltaproteobacteria bacterium]|nr:nuclear transport factor 2 family protein [Deltaproteobacteria bacterium]
MTCDRDQIANLVYTYAERLDAGDLEGTAQLFARATVRADGFAEVRRGTTEVLDLYRSTVRLYGGQPCTKHVTTNLIVEVDESALTAFARSYYTVLQATAELPLQIIIAGHYHDRFARDESGWYFTDRLMFVDLMGDLRFHLKWDPFAA